MGTYLLVAAEHSGDRPPFVPYKPSLDIQRQLRSYCGLYQAAPSCDTSPSRDAEVEQLDELAVYHLILNPRELTRHYLPCGLGSLLELLPKIIGDEEIMDCSLVRVQILSMRSHGGVVVVLKLLQLAYDTSKRGQ